MKLPRALPWVVVYFVGLSASCREANGNGLEQRLEFEWSFCGPFAAPETTGVSCCSVKVRRKEREVVGTGCGVGCGPIGIGSFGCYQQSFVDLAIVRSALCDDEPCTNYGATVSGDVVRFSKPFMGRLRVVAEVGGDEVEDATYVRCPAISPRSPKHDAGGVKAPSSDAGRRCRHDAAFVSLAPLPGIAIGAAHPAPSEDESKITFDMPSETGTRVIVRAARSAVSGEFEAPVALRIPAPDAGEGNDTEPRPLADGGLVFTSDRGGRQALWALSASSTGPLWLTQSSGQETGAFADDARVFLFASNRTGDWEIFRGTLSYGDPPVVSGAAQVQELASPGFDGYPVLASDDGGRTVLYFASDRSGALTIWRASTAWRGAPFGEPTPVAGLFEPDVEDVPGWISPDRCRLYFTRTQRGARRIWMAER